MEHFTGHWTRQADSAPSVEHNAMALNEGPSYLVKFSVSTHEPGRQQSSPEHPVLRKFNSHALGNSSQRLWGAMKLVRSALLALG